MAETYRFQGSKGILEVTEFGLSYTPQSGKDLAPSYYETGFPHAMREAYDKKWHEENDPKLGQEPMPETVSFRAPDYDDMKPHLWNFFQAVRSRKPVVEDSVFVTTQPWPATWRMNLIFETLRCLGMRFPKASRADPSNPHSLSQTPSPEMET